MRLTDWIADLARQVGDVSLLSSCSDLEPTALSSCDRSVMLAALFSPSDIVSLCQQSAELVTGSSMGHCPKSVNPLRRGFRYVVRVRPRSVDDEDHTAMTPPRRAAPHLVEERRDDIGRPPRWTLVG